MKYTFIIIYLLMSNITYSAILKEINIGLASNFSELSTVQTNPFAGHFLNGVTLAFDERKNQLESKNIKVNLVNIDYGASDFNVEKKLSDAVLSEKITAVIGYNYSSSALTAAPLHEKLKIPLLTPSATANRLGVYKSFVHSAAFSNGFMGKAISQFVLSELKLKKALIVKAVDCAYCTDLADSINTSFVENGGIIVKEIQILHEDQIFNFLNEIKPDTNYDIVFLPTQETTAAKIIRYFKDNKIEKTFIGGDGWGNTGQEFNRVLKGLNFKGYSITHWHDKLMNQQSAKFSKDYNKRFGKVPNDTAVLAYDAAHVLINAILNSRLQTAEGIEEKLNSIKSYEGLTGKYSFKGSVFPEKDALMLEVNSESMTPIKKISSGKWRSL